MIRGGRFLRLYLCSPGEVCATSGRAAGEVSDVSEDEQMRQELVTLNQRIDAMEQRRDLEALEFFNQHLADQLVCRRASGIVMGKYGQQGFMRALTTPSRFAAVRSEAMDVNLLGTRALVTLEVIATSRVGGEHRFCNIRMFSRGADGWLLELWFDYEISASPPEHAGGNEFH
jgi:hypothetical protein